MVEAGGDMETSLIGRFIVRRHGQWYGATLPPENGAEMTPLSVDDVLAWMKAPVDAEFARSLRQPAWAGRPSEGVRLPVVTPVAAFVAAVDAGRLLVESHDGSPVLLDHWDVRLIDVVGGFMAVEALVGHATEVLQLSEADAHRRIERLVHADVLSGFEDQASRAPEAPAMDVAGAADGNGWASSADSDRRWQEPLEMRMAEPLVAGHAGRIPVYAIWHSNTGPLLALGLLTAFAREVNGGRLNEYFEIRRPETAEAFLDDLASRRGPAILLCSDYVWSLDQNLEAARVGLGINPDLIVIHGGPSSPKYEDDSAEFLEMHGDVAHVLVRGEGEVVLSEVLAVLSRSLPEGVDYSALAKVDGITFRSLGGEVVRTPDQERNADLDALPSPYLTGEFDEVAAEGWNQILAIETNRGCPYGCTFCDWGSSTLSRIRKFDIERVAAEIEWAASRGVEAINFTDANFGIMSRDVEITRRLADIKRRTGFPKVVVFFPAKNTTRHLIAIMDLVLDAGIASASSLALQTTDPATLANLNRSNIPTEHFIAIAADYRRRGHPLIGDLLLGMPGQTTETYRRDLQFMLDHEIMTRTWPLQLLPNAPMNDPSYRKEYSIVSDHENLITSTSTFDRADREWMLRLRRADLIFERYGLLRHVLRFLQWDRGIEATIVLARLIDAVEREPTRYPFLAWTVEYFDLCPTVAVGWRSFYAEVRRFLSDEMEVPFDTPLESVLELQLMLMPAPGRRFPATTTLAHDYLGYYREATESLFTTGESGNPSGPLSARGPAAFTVAGDPLRLCDYGMVFDGESRRETMESEFYVGATVAFELESPLMRLLPWVGALGVAPAYLGPTSIDPDSSEVDAPSFDRAVSVELRR